MCYNISFCIYPIQYGVVLFVFLCGSIGVTWTNYDVCVCVWNSNLLTQTKSFKNFNDCIFICTLAKLTFTFICLIWIITIWPFLSYPEANIIFFLAESWVRHWIPATSADLFCVEKRIHQLEHQNIYLLSTVLRGSQNQADLTVSQYTKRLVAARQGYSCYSSQMLRKTDQPSEETFCCHCC